MSPNKKVQNHSDVNLALINMAINKGIGVIPDPVEPWLRIEAIACVLGEEVSTIHNVISAARTKLNIEIPRHPYGHYYRITDYLQYAPDAKRVAAEKVKKKTRRKKKKAVKKGVKK